MGCGRMEYSPDALPEMAMALPTCYGNMENRGFSFFWSLASHLSSLSVRDSIHWPPQVKFESFAGHERVENYAAGVHLGVEMNFTPV